ncbi:Protein CBG03931 [Caenorhabditis briggsae]|uniref:Protein CBG03931 n=1 Tax=Caenorhabditis briggsae TaxID=6238 RepID=A8WVS6_CAEBR|nr:Protein CBG03931 [Caenorhabditis briggsae]CAP24739.2 Protein CBG03931 [Caenorhabditis briggsae]
MTSTELINNYDIHLERYCNIYIRRKSGVPGDPTIFDEIDQLRFCQSVNQITDNYYNPSCPKRWDIECPKLQKALSCSLSRLINQHDLKNPFYSWGFKTKGSSFEPREPLKHIPQVGSVVTTTSSGYGTNKSSSSSQPRFDIVTEFQENCSIVGPKVNNRQEAATALKTKHELMGPECYRQQQKPKWNWHNQNKQDKNRRMEHPTSSYLSCAKMPVTHRPAAASRVPFAQQQSVGNSKNQNSLHSSTHHPKKYFTNTSEPRKQVSSHKKPSEPKLVKPKPSIKYNEFIAKPKPKFSFDPVTNVLQKNF